MKRMVCGGACLACCLGFWSLGLATPPEESARQVAVTLHAAPRVKQTLVRVEDVAAVSGGAPGLRERVEKLDLCDLKGGEPCIVTREQIYYRLLLDGVDKERFRLTGPAFATVTLAVAPPVAAKAPAKKDKGTPAEEPIIKARDMVRLVATIGATRVTATGEALQDARAGQSIRVRNTGSNKVVTGRAIERNLVEVDY